jgi:hypothetical protein
VLQVQVQVPEDMQGIGIFYASLDLTVAVPASLPVEITDSSGDISIVNVGRNVEVLSDSSGQVRVSSVEGTVNIP